MRHTHPAATATQERHAQHHQHCRLGEQDPAGQRGYRCHSLGLCRPSCGTRHMAEGAQLMIELLIQLLVLLLVFGLVWYIITLIPLPPPFPVIAQAIVALILLLVLLSYLYPAIRTPIR